MSAGAELASQNSTAVAEFTMRVSPGETIPRIRKHGWKDRDAIYLEERTWKEHHDTAEGTWMKSAKCGDRKLNCLSAVKRGKGKQSCYRLMPRNPLQLVSPAAARGSNLFISLLLCLSSVVSRASSRTTAKFSLIPWRKYFPTFLP